MSHYQFAASAWALVGFLVGYLFATFVSGGCDD